VLERLLDSIKRRLHALGHGLLAVQKAIVDPLLPAGIGRIAERFGDDRRAILFGKLVPPGRVALCNELERDVRFRIEDLGRRCPALEGDRAESGNVVTLKLCADGRTSGIVNPSAGCALGAPLAHSRHVGHRCVDLGDRRGDRCCRESGQGFGRGVGHLFSVARRRSQHPAAASAHLGQRVGQ
jgi:hypothetical protein